MLFSLAITKTVSRRGANGTRVVGKKKVWSPDLTSGAET